MDTLYYFLQSFPECAGVIALSLALARVPLRWGRILLGSAFISLICFGIRALPVTFGLHLPISIFIIFLLIIKLTKTVPSRAIISVFASFFALALLEYLVSTVFFALTHIDPNQALADESLWTMVGVIQDAVLIIIALVVPHFLKPNQGAWER
jgi:hypothetical protein